MADVRSFPDEEPVTYRLYGKNLGASAGVVEEGVRRKRA
jgi:hypothetical protein